MKSATLVLPLAIARELAEMAANPMETAATLLVGISEEGTDLKLLARELQFVPEESYRGRYEDSLIISSSGYVDALARGEEIGAGAVFVHTHPGPLGIPRPSRHDDVVDIDLAEPFRVRTGIELYASVVLSPAASWFKFTGRGTYRDEDFLIDRLVIAGERLAFLGGYDSVGFEVPPDFDRQVRAFGGDVQRVLSQLRLAVVGCGGTGSAVAEQLVRLGVRSLILADRDELSDTNVTRVYGSTPRDVGRRKVDVLADHLQGIAPDLNVTRVGAFVTEQAAARNLRKADVIFGCTDDNAGRLVLGRLAAYYLIPLFDMGVLVSSDNGQLRGVDCRVTIQTPGDACLTCRERIDMRRAAAEQLADSEREQRQREGYAPELVSNEPAVVAFTTLAASQAVIELLERIIGFGPDDVPTEVLHRVHEREMSTNTRPPLERHYCHPQAGYLGRGDSEPFLGTLWSRK